jgi:hypothetical protein
MTQLTNKNIQPSTIEDVDLQEMLDQAQDTQTQK